MTFTEIQTKLRRLNIDVCDIPQGYKIQLRSAREYAVVVRSLDEVMKQGILIYKASQDFKRVWKHIERREAYRA